MKAKIIGILLCLAVFSATVNGQRLRNEVDSLSYALGMMYGHQIQQAGFQINAEILAQTVNRFIQNETLELSIEQAGGYINMQYAKIQQQKLVKNLEAGRAFLNNNRNAPGVVSLPSGLQYRIIKAGAGAKPSATSKVTVHYHGTLIDGTVFDSSAERGHPIELSVNQVIQGWIEALQLMSVGSKWILYIPSELAYGETPRPGIEANSVLIFEVDLLSINN